MMTGNEIENCAKRCTENPRTCGNLGTGTLCLKEWQKGDSYHPFCFRVRTNQENVEKFEQDWKRIKSSLISLSGSPVVTTSQHLDMMERVRYLETLIIEISDIARSDKD